jgi:hypothetical protein
MVKITAAITADGSEFASGPGTCISCRRATTSVAHYPNYRQETPRNPRSTSSTTR